MVKFYLMVLLRFQSSLPELVGIVARFQLRMDLDASARNHFGFCGRHT